MKYAIFFKKAAAQKIIKVLENSVYYDLTRGPVYIDSCYIDFHPTEPCIYIESVNYPPGFSPSDNKSDIIRFDAGDLYRMQKNNKNAFKYLLKVYELLIISFHDTDAYDSLYIGWQVKSSNQ